MYVVFYLIILGTLGFNFMGSLETINVVDEFENDNGELETSNREVDALTDRSWLIIGLTLVWTGLSFWFIARQSIMTLFYY